MNPHVISVRPETSVGDVQTLLLEHGLSGAPVVDATGHALGVVSLRDLLRHLSVPATAAEAGQFYSDDDDYRELAQVPVDRTATPVEKLMSTRIRSVQPETGVAVAANLMRELRIHRLLVTDHGVVVGVISSWDLMRVVEEAC